MEERKCVKYGARLTDEDVMKIEKEDGSWEEISLSICPDCFTKQMRKQARTRTSRRAHNQKDYRTPHVGAKERDINKKMEYAQITFLGERGCPWFML